IQKTYDFIKWYIPILNRLPHSHKFTLGERIINHLYDLLEGLVNARYSKQKLAQLENLNSKLDLLRYQTRLLYDFELISFKRYEYINEQLKLIGTDLGAWIKQQKKL
ncbi:MAG: diversity-generating retroelement protein Avd, partial [Microcystaceae cyanobacterium]